MHVLKAYFLPVILAFIVTVFAIVLLKPLALRLGLLDAPGGRKQHQGHVPIIGGIAMFIGFSFALLTLTISLAPFRSMIAACALLVFVGILDDFHELSARSRFIAQILAAILMTIWGKNILYNFGDLVFLGNIALGWLAIPVTIFATVGVINAFNMTDGIDGLAGSLALIQFILLAILVGPANENLLLLVIIISSLVGFLIFNWHVLPRHRARVFMGDAGSMFIGFVLSWFFISLSQQPHAVATPVTMLWIFALPLFDTTFLLIKRTFQHGTPLRAGRDHLHHLLQDFGFSSMQICWSIGSLALLLGLIGVFANLYHVSASIMFVSFISLFTIYVITIYFLRKYFVNDKN